MKLIVGLGNPGEKYKNTRHNTGHIFVDMLVSKSENPERRDKRSFAIVSHIILLKEKILVAQLSTFMNESGKGVQMIMEKYGIQNASDVCIVHDDLDLSLGMYKMQLGKGPKVHNGITSVEEAIGKDFWRIRIGVDNRAQGMYVRGEAYVLSNFTEEEKFQLNDVYNRIYTSDEFASVVGGS